MASIITLIFSIIISSTTSPETISEDTQQDGLTTYYLIRHAEKDRSNPDEKDPALTEAGLQRAENWAKVLKDIHFDAIYSTNYKRTLQTAGPLADQNNLEIQKYDPNKAYNDDFKNDTRGKNVMIVGHSNTTPEFANKILGQDKYDHIDDAENGALFIIQVLPGGKKVSKVLYIN